MSDRMRSNAETMRSICVNYLTRSTSALRNLRFLGQFASLMLMLGTYFGPVRAQVAPLATSQNFIPAYSISDIRLKDFAVSVGYVFSMPNEAEYLSANERMANFLFLSHPDAIVSGKIQDRALEIFDGDARRLLSSLQMDSDTCSVVPVGIADNQTIVVAVNSSNKGSVDIGKKCFLIGLAIFSGSTPEAIKEIQSVDIRTATLLVLNRFENFGEEK